MSRVSRHLACVRQGRVERTFLQPRWGRGSRVDVFQQQDRRRGRRRKFPTVAKQHANTQKAPPAAHAVALHALTSRRGKSRPSAVGVRIT